MESAKGIRALIEPHKKTLVALLSRNLPKDTTKEQIEAIIDQELFNFEYRFVLNPDLLLCIDESIENAFRKTIMQNLSFDQDFGLIWMMDRNHKIQGKEVKLLECNKSVNGWISIYRQSGALDDLAEPLIEFNPSTKLVEKVTIGLIVPVYGTNNEIVKKETKSFSFTDADFKIWQKKSHDIKTSKSNPGNGKTLNLSGENYWNYKPVNPDGKPVTPDNPGGINPSFAITKCTRHALKRANLNANPYGKRVHEVMHRRYVDETFEDHMEEIFSEKPAAREVPDFVEKTEIREVKTEKPEVKEVKTEEVKTEKPEISISISGLTPEKAAILKLAESCNTGDEVMKVFKDNRDLLNSDEVLKKAISKIGADRRENPRTGNTEIAKVEEAKKEEVKTEEVKTEIKLDPKKITADDL